MAPLLVMAHILVLEPEQSLNLSNDHVACSHSVAQADHAFGLAQCPQQKNLPFFSSP